MTPFRSQPQNGLVKDFCDWVAPACDAPTVYSTFGGIVLVGAVLRRNVWLPYGAGRLYPNTYTLLLGPSSLYHKTSIMRFVTKALRRIEYPDGKESSEPSQYLLPNDFTRESLIDRVAKQRAGLVVLDEFREFLSTCERSYGSGLKDFVTKLYDGDRYERELKGTDAEGKQKRVVIEDSAVSIMAGCVTEYLSGSLKGDSGLVSGFWARFLLIPAWEKTRYIPPPPPPPDADAGNRLAFGLNKLRELRGPVAFDSKARAVIGAWSESRQKEIVGGEFEAVLGAFWSRLETTCLKLSLILECSKRPATKPDAISAQSVSEAINLIEHVYASLLRLLGRELVESRDMRDKARIRELVDRKPGISRRELTQRSHLLKKNLMPMIDTLIEEGTIRNGKGNCYFPLQALQDVAAGVQHG